MRVNAIRQVAFFLILPVPLSTGDTADLPNTATVQDFQEVAALVRSMTGIPRAFTCNAPRALAVREPRARPFANTPFTNTGFRKTATMRSAYFILTRASLWRLFSSGSPLCARQLRDHERDRVGQSVAHGEVSSTAHTPSKSTK